MIDSILVAVFSAVLASLFTSFYYTIRFSNHLGEILAKLGGLKEQIEALDKRTDGIERRLERLESK